MMNPDEQIERLTNNQETLEKSVTVIVAMQERLEAQVTRMIGALERLTEIMGSLTNIVQRHEDRLNGPAEPEPPKRVN